MSRLLDTNGSKISQLIPNHIWKMIDDLRKRFHSERHMERFPEEDGISVRGKEQHIAMEERVNIHKTVPERWVQITKYNTKRNQN